MKLNRWTLALVVAGAVSFSSIATAEEVQHTVLSNVSKTTLSGYVSTSAIYGIGSNGATPGRSFDGAGKLDGFNLDVVSLTLEKPLDESQWAAGYKVQLLYGPDAVGFNNVLGTPNDEFSIKQAYVNTRIPVGNGIDVKMGVFDTVIGYEVFDIPNNPNFGRSFGYAIEPTQHTGVLLSYQLTDMISFSAGVANTRDPVINATSSRIGLGDESRFTYLGSVTITLPDEAGFLAGGAIYGGIVYGLETTSGTGDNTSNYYAGFTLPTPIEGLGVGVAYDRVEDFSGLAPNGGGAIVPDAWTLAGYLSYKATDKLTVNGRFDYANGDPGTFFLDTDPGQTGDNKLLGMTVTADYQLWENVLSRIEARWDRALSPDHDIFGTGSGSTSLFTVALNLVYQF